MRPASGRHGVAVSGKNYVLLLPFAGHIPEHTHSGRRILAAVGPVSVD